VLKVDADEDGAGGETWRSATCGGLLAVSGGDEGAKGDAEEVEGAVRERLKAKATFP
jgi:hypothetical protein